MKRRSVFFLASIIIILIMYFNKFFELEYDINLLDYIKFSSDYTTEEKEILNQYNPLIYGGNINEPPLGIYYEENRQYIGMIVDYINALSIELGSTIVSQPMVWNQALEALKEGKTNLCDMVPSRERAKIFAFSDPIYKLNGIIVIHGSSKNIHNIQDLSGKTIAVQRGDYATDRLVSIDEKINIVFVNNVSDALDLLYINQVDAVAGDEPVVRYYLNELTYVNDYRILNEPLYESKCVIAVPNKQAELIPVLNKAIFNMKRKGILKKIQAKWEGHYNSTFNKNISQEKLHLGIAMFVVFSIIIGYLVYLWNKSLKLLVIEKTRKIKIISEELEIIFDGIEDYLIAIGQDLKIKNINKAFLKYLKRKKNEVLECSFIDIPLLCEFEKENDKLIYTLLHYPDEINFNSQEKYELKDKNKLFEVFIYPLGSEGTEDISILVMISDITNIKIQEQKLIHSNKMTSIGQLAAGVAHELRNPLGAIRNSTFILNDEYDDKDQLKKIALNAIDNSVTRASRIIDNLLNFSRLTQDEKQLINLEKSIFEIINFYKNQMDKKNIDLNISFEANQEVYINIESLKHILMNLIQNAIDAVPIGGNLNISCGLEMDKIIIKVMDNGIGIEDNNLDKIFDPFYTTKPVGKGTGLGLYIAYSEVQKINGEIKVYSKKNKGTTFIINIPYRSEMHGSRAENFIS